MEDYLPKDRVLDNITPCSKTNKYSRSNWSKQIKSSEKKRKSRRMIKEDSGYWDLPIYKKHSAQRKKSKRCHTPGSSRRGRRVTRKSNNKNHSNNGSQDVTRQIFKESGLQNSAMKYNRT